MKKYQSFSHTRWDCKYQCAAEEQEGGSWRDELSCGSCIGDGGCVAEKIAQVLHDRGKQDDMRA